MKLLATILCSGALLFWPMATMMSPMAMAAPGNEDSPTALATALCLIFYPVLFGLLFNHFGWSFYGFSPKTFLVLTIALPAAAATALGYPRAVLNALRGISSVGYVVTTRAVYLSGLPIPGADPQTFVAFPESHGSYARDAAHVYVRDEILEGADPASFGPLDLARPSPYWKDAHRVYYGDKPIRGADAASFTLLIDRGGFEEDKAYARDKAQVYVADQVFEGADSASFELLGTEKSRSAYSKDARSVYHHQKQVAGADVASFEVIPDTRYARDRRHVFFEGLLMDQADVATFEVLPDNRYARDHARVYMGAKWVFAEADPAVLEVLGGYAKDAEHVFAVPAEGTQDSPSIPEAHAPSFVALDNRYGKDMHRVYFRDIGTGLAHVIEGADPNSFETIFDDQWRRDAKDVHKSYLNGAVVQ